MAATSFYAKRPPRITHVLTLPTLLECGREDVWSIHKAFCSKALTDGDKPIVSQSK